MIFNDNFITCYFIVLSIGVVVQRLEAIDFKEDTYTIFTDYKITTKDFILMNDVKSALACGSVCLTQSNCCSVSYVGNTRECYLDTSGSCSSTKVPYVGSIVMIRQMYAKSGVTDPVLTTVAPVLTTDCEDVANKDGKFRISPGTGSRPYVYCELGADNRYWTVIQRRVNGQATFYRTWQAFKMGFGNVETEFWLGNVNVHMLTSNNDYSLRIELENFAKEERYAEYNSFKISDELSYFQLSIEGYSGNAGDSLAYHNGMNFSTKDRDNDPSSDRCAVDFLGAWWYNDCQRSNLNGEYLSSGSHTSSDHGIEWFTFTGPAYSLKRSKMMIRKAVSNGKGR